MVLCVFCFIILLQEFQHLLVLDLANVLIVLCEYAFLEKYDRVSVTITDKTFIFLTELPILGCITLKKLQFGLIVLSWVLIPYQLRIVDLPGEYKIVELAVLLFTYSILSFGIHLDQVVSDHLVLVGKDQMLAVIDSADLLLFFFCGGLQSYFLLNIVLSFRFLYQIKNRLVPIGDVLEVLDVIFSA